MMLHKLSTLNVLVNLTIILFIFSRFYPILMIGWLVLICAILLWQRYKIRMANLKIFLVCIAIFYPLIQYVLQDSQAAFMGLWNIRMYFAIFVFFILMVTLCRNVYSCFVTAYFFVVALDFLIWFALEVYGTELRKGWHLSHRSMGLGDRPSTSAFIHAIFLYVSIRYFRASELLLKILVISSVILIIFAFQSGIGFIMLFLISIALLYDFNKILFAFMVMFSPVVFVLIISLVLNSAMGPKLSIEYFSFLYDYKIEMVSLFYEELSVPQHFFFGLNNGEDYYFGGDFGIFETFISLGFILFVVKYAMLLYLGFQSSPPIALFSIIADFHYNVTTHTLSAFVVAIALMVAYRYRINKVSRIPDLPIRLSKAFNY
jgi:hypothetical protein